MRRSILGFEQEEVLRLSQIIEKDGKKIEINADVIDLLILQQIADFPNRKKIMKQIVDDKYYFWASYNEILEELPILRIKKQALSDRLFKMVQLGLLERKVITMGQIANATLFRIGEKYETLLYKDGGVSYQTTIRPVVNYDTSSSQLRDINNYNNISNKNIPNKENINKRKVFEKPSIDEIREFIEELGGGVDAESFYDYYEGNGWMVGRNHMKDWKATVRRWKRSSYGTSDKNNKPRDSKVRFSELDYGESDV